MNSPSLDLQWSPRLHEPERLPPHINIRICFLSSGGGHFRQLCRLGELARTYDHFLITTRANRLARDPCPFKSKYFIEDLGTGRWKTRPNRLLSGPAKLFTILRREKPDLLISTGSGIAAPAFLAAKLLRIKTIYIEAFARVCSLSLAGKICYRLADLFLVQHPQLVENWPRARYGGALYDCLAGDRHGTGNGR